MRGAEDIFVEPTGGLEQIEVRFDRSKLAQFGLNIDEANRALRIGFSGESAGARFRK